MGVLKPHTHGRARSAAVERGPVGGEPAGPHGGAHLSDTERFERAGASIVRAFVSELEAHRVAVPSLARRIWDDFSVAESAWRLAQEAGQRGHPLDLILVEGGKWCRFPKLALRGEEPLDMRGVIGETTGARDADTLAALVEALSVRRARDGASRVLGAVVVGGRSRRMAHDKMTLPVHPQLPDRGTWAERTWLLVHWVTSRCAFVGRADQDRPLRATASPLGGVEYLCDTRTGAGPLAALERALDEAHRGGEGAVLLVPGDLPYLEPVLLDTLLRGWEACSDPSDPRIRWDGVAFGRGEVASDPGEGAPVDLDPVILVVSVGMREQVRSLLDAGERRLGAVFRHGRFHALDRPSPPPDDPGAPAPLENCNRPEDWVRYAALFRESDVRPRGVPA